VPLAGFGPVSHCQGAKKLKLSKPIDCSCLAVNSRVQAGTTRRTRIGANWMKSGLSRRSMRDICREHVRVTAAGLAQRFPRVFCARGFDSRARASLCARDLHPTALDGRHPPACQPFSSPSTRRTPSKSVLQITIAPLT
jgi:hypothetical protein